MASDPRFTPLLIGLGVHNLSVSPRFIPVIKQVIRNTSVVDACYLAENALSLTCAKDILELLIAQYKKVIPQDKFYNC